MKKIVFAAAALFALSACGEKKADETPAAAPDAAAAPAAAAAAPIDSLAPMNHDSTPMAGDTAKAH